ncbi:hypothetical protein QTO34_012007 [Cnephaeus nilssonii]|uniref:Uncharacterized protein n=1 Tax=Cnephaeus nilssonii TaxID=3371016 RepID=A0AA40HBW0_CNENI|nr:hypothetical protein QTO34_012007 [Eptesicus nilssonii]
MAATTLGNTEMTKENWLLGAPSPPSPLGPQRLLLPAQRCSREKPLPEAGGGQAAAGPREFTDDEPPDQLSLVSQSPRPQEGSGSARQSDLS